MLTYKINTFSHSRLEINHQHGMWQVGCFDVVLYTCIYKDPGCTLNVCVAERVTYTCRWYLVIYYGIFVKEI